MTRYVVKVGFWLRAYDSLDIEATSDAEAIVKAKVAAKIAMESTSHPEHIDIDERRQGVIAFVDCVTSDGWQSVIDNVAFDDDRINA